VSSPLPLLHARGVRKRFPGVQALAGVDLCLRAGEIHALMGQNGAGKSTLIKVLTGVYPPDQGEVLLDGRPLRARTPLEAQQSGISTVYQEVNLCPNLSVAENIFAGRYPRRGWQGGWAIDWQRMAVQARQLLARLHLDIDVTSLLSEFPLAVRQLVAIARALGTESRVLILDEPTSSLDDDEVGRLFTVMRQMRDDGLAILFVTHFLDQVYAVSDRITVLRNGGLVGEYATATLQAADLVTAMVGRSVCLDRQATAAARGDIARRTPALEARSLGRRGRIRPTDLSLCAGEIVGVGGLLGSGRTELARLLFGLDRADHGELLLAGSRTVLDSPLDAIRHGLAFCPEDRKGEGIVAELSVSDNIILALQSRQGIWRHLSSPRQAEIAQRFIDLLEIKVADRDTAVGQLSGGNQQKVVLARWLAISPRVLILDEPTRGIDIAAKQEIMDEIRRLAGQGLAVLFISSEIDEVARLSDRITVLRDRRKIGELPGGSDEHAVYRMIAAGS